MYDDWYDKLEEISRFIALLKKPFPTFHVAKSVGEAISRGESGGEENALERFETNCILAQEIGSQKLVLHLWNGVYSDNDFSRNVKAYEPLRRIADCYGLLLTVENVVCNMGTPISRLKELLEIFPDIAFTFDVKMSQIHGELDNVYKEENGDVFRHVAHMHISDYRGGIKDWSNLKTLHIGEGQIDFERFFRFVKDIGYCGDFTIEALSVDESGTMDFDKMNESVKKLRAYIA